MGKKLYVGNLPFSANEDALRDIFSQAGTVESAKIIMDKQTGRSKGFGFVEMASDEDAANSITKFNGADYDGRTMTVAEARPLASGEGRSGGGFRGGRGGFRGNGNGRSFGQNRY